MPDPADLVAPTAKALLACLQGKLDEYDAPVVRAFMAPGGPPAWDTCCAEGDREGQAWVQIPQIGPTDNFPTIQTGAFRCWPGHHAVQMNVAILRCASTIDDNGDPPAAAVLTAEFDKVQRDRAIIDETLQCCFLADADEGTYTVGLWTPLGPQGGCVGGSRQVSIEVKSCRCPE